jgi:hypothetical protein
MKRADLPKFKKNKVLNILNIFLASEFPARVDTLLNEPSEPVFYITLHAILNPLNLAGMLEKGETLYNEGKYLDFSKVLKHAHAFLKITAEEEE